MLPSEPGMLLSVINTKLRDEFKSLDELCEELDEDKASIIAILKAAGHNYDEEHNCFK